MCSAAGDMIHLPKYLSEMEAYGKLARNESLISNRNWFLSMEQRPVLQCRHQVMKLALDSMKLIETTHDQAHQLPKSQLGADLAHSQTDTPCIL